MLPNHRVFLILATAVATAGAAGAARAQLTVNESGFLAQSLSGVICKQVELGSGGVDTCVYYGTPDGLLRRCGDADPGTICDPNLTFPVGVAFGSGGSFGTDMYVADYGIGDIHRSSGCGPSTVFASIPGPGAIAFPPAGSAYGDYLYACEAFDGPVFRVAPDGSVTSWLDLASTYLRFGPGGAWGQQLYATEDIAPVESRIVRVSPTGAVTPIVADFVAPEGFDWGFDGDLFATDPILGEVRRVHLDGSYTVFATLPGAADVAYRADRQALYVASNQGGVYRITRGSTSDAADRAEAFRALAVSPNPTRGACTARFASARGGLVRARVLDVSGRCVRRLSESWRPAGANAIAWDGRDDLGASVPPGAYFVRVTLGAEQWHSRVVVAR